MKKKAELVEKEIEELKIDLQLERDAVEQQIKIEGDIREKLNKMEKSQRRMIDFHAEYKYKARDIGSLSDILSLQEFTFLLSYFFCRLSFYLDTDEGPHGLALEINEEMDQPISDHGYIPVFLKPDPESSLLVRLEEKPNEVE